MKRKEQKSAGDEDGPPESDEEEDADDDFEQKAPDALTSDSDPESPRSDQEMPSQSQTVVLPVADTQPREPFVAWRSA